MVEEPSSIECRGYRVVGRVQGVGFRFWTRRTAERLGLAGTVRNLPDGSVEVVARGSRQAIATLEGELRKGPPASRVERVEHIGGAHPGSLEGFRVVH
jgi:acylphosphatase